MILAEGEAGELRQLMAGPTAAGPPQITAGREPEAGRLTDALAVHQVRSCEQLQRWACTCGAADWAAAGETPQQTAAAHQAAAVLAHLAAP